MTALVQEAVSEKIDQTFYQDHKEQQPEFVRTKIEYPESDGKPMGETGFHVKATMLLYESLRHFFRNQDDVYVAADMFLYYQEGNPRANKAPDVMVIKGVSSRERRVFKTWEEGAVPCVIFEVTSDSTMAEDMVSKSALYASLGVQEYFLFDPMHEYLHAGVMGFRLEESEYIPFIPDKNGCLLSEELGVLLRSEERVLRVINPQTGEPVPYLDEAVTRAEQEMQRAEQEAQRAEQEAQRAEQEAQRAERLAAQLRALGIEPEE